MKSGGEALPKFRLGLPGRQELDDARQEDDFSDAEKDAYEKQDIGSS